ncbi:MAG: winged helix-turn-helix domain-containing protein [Alphaproteobacteria bacterium]|nr:winged helix-turn-helix domain-containing protein [Alphaproteobacteria bacterium]
MSILIVSPSVYLSYLIPQLLVPGTKIHPVTQIPEAEDALWKGLTLMIIDQQKAIDILKPVSPGEWKHITTWAKPVSAKQLQQSITENEMQQEEKDPVIHIGNYSLYPRGKYLMDMEQRVMVNLTTKEVEIITFLAQHGTTGVSKEQLLKSLWGIHTGMETHTVETHIYRLRQKINQFLNVSDFLVTDATGYKLGGLGSDK